MSIRTTIALVASDLRMNCERIQETAVLLPMRSISNKITTAISESGTCSPKCELYSSSEMFVGQTSHHPQGSMEHPAYN